MSSFEIFKGKCLENNEIHLKIKIGSAHYHSLKGVFLIEINGTEKGSTWLKPLKDPRYSEDFSILYKRTSDNLEVIGTGKIILNGRQRYIQLSWNLYGHEDHFIKLNDIASNIITFEKALNTNLNQRGEQIIA